MNGYAVVVSHIEGCDWALVLTASRVDDQRYFTPFLFAFDSAGLFAACPNADVWARRNLLRVFKAHGLSNDARKELLENAISDILRQISSCARVLEHKKVGLIQKMKAGGYEQTLPGFTLAAEHAFRWLYEHKRGENAVAAMRICRYLADKHKIGELSLAELESYAEGKILNQRIGA